MSAQNYSPDALILLAEDNEDDITLFCSALLKAEIRNPMEIVRDGEEAIAYLKGDGRFSDRARYPLPGLLLLDLSMPRKDGFQVLDWIRRQPELKGLRVVVLTGSRDVYNLSRAYYLGAHSFFVKSLDSQTVAQLVESIQGYWVAAGFGPRVSQPDKPSSSGQQKASPP